MTDSHKKCRYCFQSIEPLAKVCQHCGRHQNCFWQHFRIEHIGLLASVIMVLIAISQLNEAREERIVANDALKRAEEAKNTALSAAEDANEAYETTRDLALTLTRIVYFQTITKREIGTARSKTAIEKIEKELNRVIKKMIPDSGERKAFIRDLDSEPPNKN